MNYECEQVTDDLSPIKLPRNWSQTVRHAVLNVIGLMRIVMLTGREFLIEKGDTFAANTRTISQPTC
jgi:hypothetical protein